MALDQLANEEARRVFLNDHYLKLPFSQAGGCRGMTGMGTWETLATIFAAEASDVLIVREGRRWEGAEQPTFDEARRLFDEGYTLLVRHAERHHPQLAGLAASFQADFCAPVDIHLYFTPAEQFGFGWHYDAEDVFILQTAGRKEYQLRKNTVNPWPLVETLPLDMRYEREIMPLVRCELAAGDWLYIPHGYWHKANAKEASISLAVGVQSTSAMDVLDFLRGQLLDSLRWRQRIPAPGKAYESTNGDLLAQYETLFAELAADLHGALTSESFRRRFLETREAQAEKSKP